AHSPVELGRVVRVRREELAFTLAQVAGLTGVDPIVIDRLERDDGTTELQAVMLVLQLLGLEILVGEIYSYRCPTSPSGSAMPTTRPNALCSTLSTCASSTRRWAIGSPSAPR
ncbi:MAG: hypothetical protein JWN10_2924, partial [Solirubrobacterales bacterium]|nr:hypothetical protein [Solirubrobacterales bacterium]